MHEQRQYYSDWVRSNLSDRFNLEERCILNPRKRAAMLGLLYYTKFIYEELDELRLRRIMLTVQYVTEYRVPVILTTQTDLLISK